MIEDVVAELLPVCALCKHRAPKPFDLLPPKGILTWKHGEATCYDENFWYKWLLASGTQWWTL